MHTHSESSAVGSALRSGRRGRAFESPLSDTSGSRSISAAAFWYPFRPPAAPEVPPDETAPGRRGRPLWRDRTQAGRRAGTAAGDFNTICFRAENVLSLYSESAGAVRNRPLFRICKPVPGRNCPYDRKNYMASGCSYMPCSCFCPCMCGKLQGMYAPPNVQER